MAVQAYEGGCQCGAVRWKTKLDTDGAIACNCSRCGRLGLYLCFVAEGDFELTKGEGASTEYLFNRHAIHHLFCSTCGVQSYARGQAPDGNKMVAVNIRCLDGVNVHDLHPKPYDGRNA